MLKLKFLVILKGNFLTTSLISGVGITLRWVCFKSHESKTIYKYMFLTKILEVETEPQYKATNILINSNKYAMGVARP